MGRSTETVSGVSTDGVLQREDEQLSTSVAERVGIHGCTLLPTEARQWSKSHSQLTSEAICGELPSQTKGCILLTPLHLGTGYCCGSVCLD